MDFFNNDKVSEEGAIEFDSDIQKDEERRTLVAEEEEEDQLLAEDGDEKVRHGSVMNHKWRMRIYLTVVSPFMM